MTRKAIRKVSILDGIYGISAILVVASGLTLWFWVGKPSEFYTSNGVFHAKVTLFIVVGLLSVIPTIFFLKNRKGDQEEVVELPKRIIMFIRIELLLLFLIPMFAVLMASGVGN